MMIIKKENDIYYDYFLKQNSRLFSPNVFFSVIMTFSDHSDIGHIWWVYLKWKLNHTCIKFPHTIKYYQHGFIRYHMWYPKHL